MDTVANRDAFLVRTYSYDKAFEPCERSEKRFWDGMKEAKDERPGGTGRRFRVVGSGSHAAGNPGDGGDWTEGRQPQEVQCEVVAAQTDFGVDVSTKFLEAAKDDGSFSGDGEAEKIADGISGFYSYLDRLLSCGHGTGRLAIVASNSGPSTTVTVGGDLDTPESVFQLRRNQPIDFVDLDTGGTVQATTAIVDKDPFNHQIEVEDNVTVVAGWGIYQAGVYGNSIPMGNRGIVDDGSFAANYFGQVRADVPYLNAVVLDGNGGMQDYSEELVEEGTGAVGEESKYMPTRLRCNRGIILEHKRVVTSQRDFMVTGDGAVQGSLGMDHNKLAFVSGDTKIPFVEDRNLPARELYGEWVPGYRKHILRRPDWVRSNGAIFHTKVAVGGGTYAHAMTADIMGDVAISHRRPNANVVWRNIRDRFSGRDS